MKMKKADAMPKMNKANARGDYSKDIGWKGEAPDYKQTRFWLGRQAGEALMRAGRLDRCWQAVEARWGQDRNVGRCVWDEVSFAIAQAVARGEDTVTIEPPADVLADGNDEPATLVSWLRRLQDEFPFVRLALADGEAQTVGEEFWQKEARELMERARRLMRRNSSQTLHQAFDAFTAYLPTRPRYSDHEGALTPTGQVSMKEMSLLKERHKDICLADLDGEAMEAMENYWIKRPLRSDRKRPMKAKTCDNVIKRLRMFFRWLHKNKAFDWRLPEDYEAVKVEFVESADERAKRSNTRQVETFNTDELRLLWTHAKPEQRLLMVLGLNCGFGIAEISTLQLSEIHLDTTHSEYGITGSFIQRIRGKTSVYGEHQLWDVTVEAIRWYLAQRPSTEATTLLVNRKGRPLAAQTSGGNRAQKIPNNWLSLVARLRKLENLPDWRKGRSCSVNKLRKTATNGIRKLRGGELAGIFSCRGTPVRSDELLDFYSNRPFDQVFDAIREWGEKLADVFGAVPEPFARGKRKHKTSESYTSQRRAVLALRETGKTYREIASEMEVSYRTVVRHCQQGGAGGRAKKQTAVG